MEGNFDLSRMPLEGVLKLIVAEVARELNKQNVELIATKLDELKQVMLEQNAQMQVANGTRANQGANEEVIFGYFHRNDPVNKRDKRLYVGDHAPFTSKDSVQRFSKRHPGLFVKGGNGLLVAYAGDIYDALTNVSLRNKLNGGGIRFNNKRR